MRNSECSHAKSVVACTSYLCASVRACISAVCVGARAYPRARTHAHELQEGNDYRKGRSSNNRTRMTINRHISRSHNMMPALHRMGRDHRTQSKTKHTKYVLVTAPCRDESAPSAQSNLTCNICERNEKGEGERARRKWGRKGQEIRGGRDKKVRGRGKGAWRGGAGGGGGGGVNP